MLRSVQNAGRCLASAKAGVNMKQTAAANKRPTVETAPYQDCLTQAEICREQAREAASLKRYAAARGLFSTAVSLYQRATALGGGLHSEEALRQLNTEMFAYSELTRSRTRPLLARPR